jgi:hypothetical protein
MTNPVDAAIAAALAAAQNAQANPSAVVPAGQTSSAVSTAVAPAPVKLSMETMQAGQMSVDAWLKVKEDGLKIGDMPGLLPEIRVKLNMVDGQGFMLKYAIKAGNPAQYAYTYDRSTAVGGGTWPEAQARIRALEPAGKRPPSEYRAVDLPFTLLEDVTVGKGKDAKVIAKAGDTLGYTTSTTNWANWEQFYKEVEKAKLIGQTVEVKLSAQARKNNAGNTWGVVAFELVGVAPDESDGE